jgi:hypothetical protein
MKLRLFLFLFLACSLLAGRAYAQGCSTAPIPFPTNNNHLVPSGTCIANVDPNSPTGQGGRLRWNDNSNHELVLFDSDSGGIFLWCAGGGHDSTKCALGHSLCLQADGNMVIYAESSTCSGTPVWASNTQGQNFANERLVVNKNVVWKSLLRTGDRAVVRNDNGPQWVSTGYTDSN